MIRQDLIDHALARSHEKQSGGTQVEHEFKRQGSRSARQRQYCVYLPEDYSEKHRYPLIMVLHGCRQDHSAIQAVAGFDAIADREGAIIVYPFVTAHSSMRTQYCWGWWLNQHRHRGRGEVLDLQRIAEQVCETYSVDEERRHICGLSSGGAMSVASLAAYSDFWASGASVAGVPFGESSKSVRTNAHLAVRHKTLNTLVRVLRRELVAAAPPLLVVQAEADRIVDPQLGRNLRDTWISVSESEQASSAQMCAMYSGSRWNFEQYCTDDALRVGHLLIEDIGHGWPGGLPGEFSFPDAPNVSELIWTFFEHAAIQ